MYGSHPFYLNLAAAGTAHGVVGGVYVCVHVHARMRACACAYVAFLCAHVNACVRVFEFVCMCVDVLQ